MTPGELHHLELWVADLRTAERSWGWLLGALGYQPGDGWEAGRTWYRGATYLVIEQSEALSAATHDRRRPGLNHVAFHAGSRADVDRLTALAPGYGWSLLFGEKHPFAGGPQHYAAYLSDEQGFEVELVAE